MIARSPDGSIPSRNTLFASEGWQFARVGVRTSRKGLDGSQGPRIRVRKQRRGGGCGSPADPRSFRSRESYPTVWQMKDEHPGNASARTCRSSPSPFSLSLAFYHAPTFSFSRSLSLSFMFPRGSHRHKVSQANGTRFAASPLPPRSSRPFFSPVSRPLLSTAPAPPPLRPSSRAIRPSPVSEARVLPLARSYVARRTKRDPRVTVRPGNGRKTRSGEGRKEGKALAEKESEFFLFHSHLRIHPRSCGMP